MLLLSDFSVIYLNITSTLLVALFRRSNIFFFDCEAKLHYRYSYSTSISTKIFSLCDSCKLPCTPHDKEKLKASDIAKHRAVFP